MQYTAILFCTRDNTETSSESCARVSEFILVVRVEKKRSSNMQVLPNPIDQSIYTLEYAENLAPTIRSRTGIKMDAEPSGYVGE